MNAARINIPVAPLTPHHGGTRRPLCVPARECALNETARPRQPPDDIFRKPSHPRQAPVVALLAPPAVRQANRRLTVYVVWRVQYASDFAERIQLELAILGRLEAAGVQATPYRESQTFDSDWSGPGFMAASALQDKIDSHAQHLCSLLPSVATLGARVGHRLTGMELYMLLEANEFDLDQAVAEAEAGGRSASQNCAAAFDRDPMIRDMIVQAESEVSANTYPDYHRILAPGEDGEGRGALFLSNERFVGHVGARPQ